MNGLISLNFNGFPAGYCWPGNPDDFAVDLYKYTSVSFSATGTVYYNIGDTEPPADRREFAWVRTGAGTLDGLYYWNVNVGAWVKPHPIPPSSDVRLIYVGSLSDLQTYDGGDTGPIGEASGPMWELDPEFAAKFPVGVGTFQNAGTIAVGDSTTDKNVAGEDEHTLSAEEVAPHTHGYFDPRIGSGEGIQGDSDSQKVMYKHPDNEDCSGTTCQNEGGEPHNNLPPMIGVYFIKRTSRVYYTV